MLNDKIEVLRERLNDMMTSNDVDKSELLKASEELDLLIVASMKDQKKKYDEQNDSMATEIESLVDKLKLFYRAYQSIRIVDPVRKKVYDVINNKLVEQDNHCYTFWGKNLICDNCISIRAYNENDAIFKMEVKEGRIYLITAFPVAIGRRTLIIEMIKDASNSMLLSNETQNNGSQLFPAVEYMNQAAVKDPLTELYNRRFMNERLQADMLNTTINKEPLSFIFADIDYFKKINDTYGHTTGDYVLAGVSKEIRKHLAKDRQWAARYGGDEFFICLPGVDKEKAYIIAEKIHKGIEGKKFVINKQIVSVTCSFGVESICNGDYCLTIEELINLADRKLYKAKNRGRNMVI